MTHIKLRLRIRLSFYFRLSLITIAYLMWARLISIERGFRWAEGLARHWPMEVM